MNQWVPEGAEYVASLFWPGNTIKALLVTGAWTPNLTDGGDAFVSDIPSGAIISRSGAFTSKTYAGGILNAATITFSLPAAGNICKYVVIYIDFGTGDGTARLLFSDDTAKGLPVTTDGQDVAVQWDMGTFKIAAVGIF